MRQRASYFTAVGTMAVFFACAPLCLADEYSQGTSDYAAGNFAKAKEHLVKATAAKPKSWQAHYQLANTYVQLKESANAKKSYGKCLSCNPPADIKANCERAMSYITSNPSLTAPAAAAPRPSMYSSGTRSSASSTSVSTSSGSGAVDPHASQKDAAKQRIMAEAEAQIAKMKAEEDERHREMVAGANQVYRNPDGSVTTGLSSEEEAAFQKEVEQKAAAIRESARRRAESVK